MDIKEKQSRKYFLKIFSKTDINILSWVPGDDQENARWFMGGCGGTGCGLCASVR